MKQKIKVFILGIAAGSAIGVGGLLFTLLSSVNEKLLGSIAFAVGLFTVCFFGLFLYTGKIGYFPHNNNKKAYALDLLIGYIGNLFGAVILGLICSLIFKDNQAVMDTIKSISLKRFVDIGNGGTPFYNILLGSIFCGMCVYIAVATFKSKEPFILRLLILIAFVFIFVYSGFEHCIANMFYLSMGLSWNVQTILDIVIVTIGNSLGAIILNLIPIKLK